MIKDFQRAAIITPVREISYNELLRRITHFAQLLPVERGQRVVVFAENREAWAYAFFSIWAQGAIAVPVDASNTAEDLAYIINDCTPAAAWVSRKRLDTMNEALSQCGHKPKVALMDDYEVAEHTAQQPAKIDYKDEETADNN